jgi:hypothetical protein
MFFRSRMSDQRSDYLSWKLFSALVAIFLISNLSCSRPFQIGETDFGSSITKQGKITDTKLKYAFTYKGKNSYKDLFDFIYFEGDTVCFSIDLSQAPDKPVKVYFRDESGSVSILAERIEQKGDHVWGYSLVGSLLEQFHKKDLHQEIGDHLIAQPFVIRVEAEREGISVSSEARKEFVVNF